MAVQFPENLLAENLPVVREMSSRSVRLLGLGTAVPAHVLPQDLVQRKASRILGERYPEFARLAQTFLSSGINRRHSVVPFEWFEEPQDWPSRTQAYLEGATQLFKQATKAALASSGLRACDIDTIVSVSSTGIATPTLEARAMAELGFKRTVKRIPVFGLGCAGGVSGLSIAARAASSEPGSHVLLVAIETCTLSFRSDRLQKADIIATVLFGDGAAAAIVSAGAGEGPLVGKGMEYTWPDTLPIMGWDVDADGFGVVFDRSIPGFVKEHFCDAVDGALEDSGLSLGDVDRFICHPGGARVVEAIEAALRLDEGSLDHERAILKDYGNMSAPTVLFVLDRVMKFEPKGQMMMAALGPGFTASTLPILFG